MAVKIELENVIKPHTLIETKLKNSNVWIKTKVLNIYRQFLEIGLADEYATSALMIGDHLDCRIVEDKTITLMIAEVYNIKFASFSVVLKIDNIQTIQNSRSHKRYDVYLNASFCRKGDAVTGVSITELSRFISVSVLTLNQAYVFAVFDFSILPICCSAQH